MDNRIHHPCSTCQLAGNGSKMCGKKGCKIWRAWFLTAWEQTCEPLRRLLPTQTPEPEQDGPRP